MLVWGQSQHNSVTLGWQFTQAEVSVLICIWGFIFSSIGIRTFQKCKMFGAGSPIEVLFRIARI